MKKKFSFLLAIVMIVCTLTIGLVACAPSDPDPFTAANSSRELGNIYDAWAKEHLKLSGNSLGIDAKINLKDSEKDLTILLQGGITINKENDDILRFAILDNKKTDQKETFEVKLNQNGLFVFAPDFQEKTIFAQNVFLELGSMLKNLEIDDFASLSEIIKPVIVELVNGTLIGGVTVDPVKTKDGKFVVKYNFSISLYDFVEQIVYLAVPAQADSIMNVLASQIEDVNVDFAITTTGNNQEKVEKPKKSEHKYNYVGGTLTKLTMSAKGMDIDAKDIKIGTTIPTITNPNPEDCVLADDVLLVNHMDGTFVMKDAEGGVVATYDWIVDIDFDGVTDIVPTIIQCVQQKNAMPLINKMFTDNKGKLFVEVTHNCGDDCLIPHESKVSRQVLTVAYDPSSFATDRVYVAVNLMNILPNKEEMVKIVKTILKKNGINEDFAALAVGIFYQELPQEDAIVSFSPTTLMKIEELKAEANGQEVKPEQATLSIVNSMLSAEQNKAVSLPIKDIIDTILGEIDIEDLDPEIVSMLFEAMLPGVETAEIDGVYKQGGYDNENDIKTRFINGRSFLMKGNPDDKDKVDAIPIGSEIEFAKNAKNIYDLNTNIKLYDNEGNINPLLSYNEIMGLIGATINVTYDDIKGNKGINDQLAVIDVIAKDKAGKQTIYLVLGNARTTGALGHSLYKCFDQLYGLVGGMGEDMSASIAQLAEIAIPEAVIELEVDLTELDNEEWITENPWEDKTYHVGDMLGTTYDIKLNFNNGEEKLYSDIKPIEGDDFVNIYVKDGAVSAAFPFALNYEFIGFAKNINVNVEARTEDIYTAENTGTVGSEISIGSTSIFTPAISMVVMDPIAGTSKKVDLAYHEMFLKKSIENCGKNAELIIEDSVIAKTYKVKFKKAGEYKFELLEKTGKKVVVTFVIE